MGDPAWGARVRSHVGNTALSWLGCPASSWLKSFPNANGPLPVQGSDTLIPGALAYVGSVASSSSAMAQAAEMANA